MTILFGFMTLITVPIIIYVLTLCLISSPYANDIAYYTVGNGKTLKVGILGDSQLIHSDNDTYYNYTSHLYKAFQVLKDRNVNVIIFTGDIANTASEYGFKIFKKAFDDTFNNPETKPILNLLMGNHDYWFNRYISTISISSQRLFENIFQEKPFTHKVINGFHFINWSSIDSSSVTSNANIMWAKQHIQIAINDNSTRPVFVSTHLAPYNTIYGSINWGNRLISLLLKDYYQVVSFSGHSHFSLMDERSLWQKEFTAITTQAVAYIELEFGKENGCVPKDEYNDKEFSRRNYMGIVMDVDEDKIELQRVSFEKDVNYKEPWVIEMPMNKSNFKYVRDNANNEYDFPYFPKDYIIQYKQVEHNGKKFRHLMFTQAKINKGLVHTYRVVFQKEGSKDNDKMEFLYFSDFILLPEDRSEIYTVKIPRKITKGKYTVEITAIESFGNESETISGIINI